MSGGVTMAFTKWGGVQHWTSVLQRLGEDEYGTWLGAASGRRMWRPGHDVRLGYACVAVLPRDEMFVAHFNAGDDRQRAPVRTYVDITTIPRWETPDTVTMVDLDLDVVEHWDGRVEEVDRDEFDEHRCAYSYPAALVTGAERSSTAVLTGLVSGQEPYATVGWRWLRRLGGRVGPP